VVDRAREHPLELGPADAVLELGGLRGGFGDGRVVVLGGAEVEQDDGIVQVARQLLDRRQALFQRRPLARDALGLLLVVPEAGRERLLLEAVDLRFQLRKVKDAPLAP
jgi:hypothetical protein